MNKVEDEKLENIENCWQKKNDLPKVLMIMIMTDQPTLSTLQF